MMKLPERDDVWEGLMLKSGMETKSHYKEVDRPKRKMRNNALYFPHISIPNTSWTLRTLLYWDKLYSIVPIEFANRPEELDDHMRELVDAELVTALTPAAYLYRVSAFEETFCSFLDAKLKVLERMPVRDVPRRRTLIHVEKLGRIPKYLVERGVAERQSASWYNVDESIANLFMSYLAVCLGGIDEIDAAPVTNRLEYARPFGRGTSTRSSKAPEHENARDEILQCLLPAPHGRVTLKQLVEFKAKHGELLPGLRTMVEAESARIAMLTDQEDRSDATRDFLNRCQVQVNELCDAMRFSWTKVDFISLLPLVGTGLQLIATPHEGVTGYTGAALNFAGAAYLALSSVQRLNDIQRRQPLAYVAHAHRRLANAK